MSLPKLSKTGVLVLEVDFVFCFEENGLFGDSSESSFSSGKAEEVGYSIISSDPDLLSLFPINGKLPEIAIVVTIEEALGHCSKAYRRSKLWENDYKPNDKVPTLAELMSDHLQLDQGLSKELDDGIASDVRERMY